MSVRADAETLRQIPIFADCESVHLQLLAFASERQHFATGEAIIKQGEKAKSAFLMLSGHAEIWQRIGNDAQLIASAEPGTFLGEVAMIGKTTYSVSALASSSVSTARIDHALFLRVANEYPEFGQTIFNAMARRLDSSMRDFDSVKNYFARPKSFSDF
jgi:CRP/FNR family transcriptional regulator, cyclic AMP receptor protein